MPLHFQLSSEVGWNIDWDARPETKPVSPYWQGIPVPAGLADVPD